MEFIIDNATITVSTESGSMYVFRKEGDKISFLRDMMEGVVTRFNQPIKLGGILDFNFRKYNIYYQLQQSTMFLMSSPITKIEIG